MNNDQFIRYKALDRCFRNEYGSFDIDDLIEVCTNAVRNYHADPERNPVSRRTIEKDLQDMKDYYNVKFREKLKRGKKKLYIAEHHALVASALLVLFLTVHTPLDIGALLMDGGEDAA